MIRTYCGACLVGVLILCGSVLAQPFEAEQGLRKTRIRAGSNRTIIATKGGYSKSKALGGVASMDLPYPHPRMVGFSPRVAITTSNEGRPLGGDFEFDHELESGYVGDPLNPDAPDGFVIGYLDSGSDVNLVAGSAKEELGLSGFNLTESTVPIGGVGGQTVATITMPVGFFAAGLSAIDSGGALDYSALIGHSNVCGLAAPPIDCGVGELVAAIMGNPFVAFHNSIIWVDTPQEVNIRGTVFQGPEVQIQYPWESLPFFEHKVSMTFAGLSPIATTANYFPDFLTLTTPIFPTLLSLLPGTIPTGGAFLTTLSVLHGEPGPFNTVQPMRVLVDTGAQSSIMSPGMAARLSLPNDPDFTIDVCGVGGLVEGIEGFYVDFVRMNARGGALDFAEAPFVILDLPAPDGSVLDGILGMNFFWNRNVIFEPALGQSAFLHVSAPIPVAFADSDVDFDVDLDDAKFLTTCVNGPASATRVNPECRHLDLDGDDDLDLADYRAFQLCFSGSGVDADPDCGS